MTGTAAGTVATLPTTRLMPPTPRDFEIYRLNCIEHASTYALAERFKISQTRVRQIVYRVGQWLASILPARSDVAKEQEARLAQCLAADQLQSQAEKLQVFWEQTHDVKYLRQQSRVIVALARLGVVPGAIDAAAAEAIEDDGRGAGASPEREVNQAANGNAMENTGRSEAYPTNPPAGDCSRAPDSASQLAMTVTDGGDVTAAFSKTYDDNQAGLSEDLEAMQLLERRLLTVLDGLPPSDTERRQDLEINLTNIRRERATIELRLSADQKGAKIIDVPGTHVPETGERRSEQVREFPAVITSHPETAQACSGLLAAEQCVGDGNAVSAFGV